MNKPRPFIVNNYYKPMVLDKIYADDLYSQFGTMTYEEMKEKIQTNFNLNFRNEYGENLAFAVIKNETAEFTELQKLEIIKELSVRGVPLCSINQYNQTFLHEASKKGYYDILKHYENQNCGLNTIDNYGNAPIHYAVDALVFNCDENNIIEDEMTNKDVAYKNYNKAIKEVQNNEENLNKIKQIIENQKYFKVEELEKIIIASKKDYERLKINNINTNDFLIEVFNKFKKEYTYKNEREIFNDNTIEFELDKLTNLNSKYIINFDDKNDYVFGKFKLELTKYYNDNKIERYEFTDDKFLMIVSNEKKNFDIVKYVFYKFIEKYTNANGIQNIYNFTDNKYIKKILTIDNVNYNSDEITEQIINNNQYKNNYQNDYIQNVIKVKIKELEINVNKLKPDIGQIIDFYNKIILNINKTITNYFQKIFGILANNKFIKDINKFIVVEIINNNETYDDKKILFFDVLDDMQNWIEPIMDYNIFEDKIKKKANNFCNDNKINKKKYIEIVENVEKYINLFPLSKEEKISIIDLYVKTNEIIKGEDCNFIKEEINKILDNIKIIISNNITEKLNIIKPILKNIFEMYFDIIKIKKENLNNFIKHNNELIKLISDTITNIDNIKTINDDITKNIDKYINNKLMENNINEYNNYTNNLIKEDIKQHIVSYNEYINKINDNCNILNEKIKLNVLNDEYNNIINNINNIYNNFKNKEYINEIFEKAELNNIKFYQQNIDDIKFDEIEKLNNYKYDIDDINENTLIYNLNLNSSDKNNYLSFHLVKFLEKNNLQYNLKDLNEIIKLLDIQRYTIPNYFKQNDNNDNIDNIEINDNILNISSDFADNKIYYYKKINDFINNKDDNKFTKNIKYLMDILYFSNYLQNLFIKNMTENIQIFSLINNFNLNFIETQKSLHKYYQENSEELTIINKDGIKKYYDFIFTTYVNISNIVEINNKQVALNSLKNNKNNTYTNRVINNVIKIPFEMFIKTKPEEIQNLFILYYYTNNFNILYCNTPNILNINVEDKYKINDFDKIKTNAKYNKGYILDNNNYKQENNFIYNDKWKNNIYKNNIDYNINTQTYNLSIKDTPDDKIEPIVNYYINYAIQMYSNKIIDSIKNNIEIEMDLLKSNASEILNTYIESLINNECYNLLFFIDDQEKVSNTIDYLKQLENDINRNKIKNSTDKIKSNEIIKLESNKCITKKIIDKFNKINFNYGIIDKNGNTILTRLIEQYNINAIGKINDNRIKFIIGIKNNQGYDGFEYLNNKIHVLTGYDDVIKNKLNDYAYILIELLKQNNLDILNELNDTNFINELYKNGYNAGKINIEIIVNTFIKQLNKHYDVSDIAVNKKINDILLPLLEINLTTNDIQYLIFEIYNLYKIPKNNTNDEYLNKLINFYKTITEKITLNINNELNINNANKSKIDVLNNIGLILQQKSN
jgi:hypothetical protein